MAVQPSKSVFVCAHMHVHMCMGGWVNLELSEFVAGIEIRLQNLLFNTV
jgi:hypothetical protein